MKKKLILALLLVIVIAGFVAFYQCYLGDYLMQNDFALKTPIVTERGDKFNCIYKDRISNEVYISYKIYHYENGKWQKIMECGGECFSSTVYGINIDEIYQDKDIVVYNVQGYIKNGQIERYLLVDKSNDKGIDLVTKLGDAYFNMTKEQIRKDEILNKAKGFIFNYSMPQDDDYKYHRLYCAKVKDAFKEQ